MSGLSQQERAAEEQQLRDLAQQLRDLTTCTAGSDHVESIESFAEQAERFADLIRDAVTPELAASVASKAAAKRDRWMELIEMLQYSIQVEGQTPEEAEAIAKEALRDAEVNMRRTAEQLRAVADSGASSVFNAIGAVAREAEACLAEFSAAETDEVKAAVYALFQESKTRWLAQMEDMHSNVADGSESQAPTEAPDPLEPACEYVDDTSYEVSCKTTSGGYGGAFGDYTSFGLGVGCSAPAQASAASDSDAPASSSSLAAPPELGADASPEKVREQLATYLSDKEEGFLVTLRKAVAQVKEDERFQGVHEDAAKLLEQMELASGAVIPEALTQEFSDDVAGAEDKLKATVEPMRKAQWGGFYAKKAAFTVRKYDLYVRKGKMPKLADEHAELIECATVAVDLAEFLRKEAQNAIMDSVTGLVAATTQ